jgi:MFS family permease
MSPPALPPRTPDYPKLLKRLGLVFLAWMVVLVAAAGVVRLVKPGHVVIIVLVVVFVAGLAIGYVVVSSSFVREQLGGRRAPRLSSMVRAVGVPGVVFSCLAMLGLPLTILGAVSHLHWLLIPGLVLLVAELVDQSIIWPARRAREGRT